MTFIKSSVLIPNQNTSTPGVIARISLALAILSSGATLATAQDLNMKPGLWEFTTTHETKGDPMSMVSAADKAQMEQAKAQIEQAKARMSPQQRAQMDALTKAVAAAPRTVTQTGKKCVTKESIHKTLAGFAAEQAESNCKFTSLNSTGTVVERRHVCSPTNGVSSEGTVRFEAPNPETLRVTADATMTREGGVYEVKMTSDGKWLGSACGDVKP